MLSNTPAFLIPTWHSMGEDRQNQLIARMNGLITSGASTEEIARKFTGNLLSDVRRGKLMAVPKKENVTKTLAGILQHPGLTAEQKVALLQGFTGLTPDQKPEPQPKARQVGGRRPHRQSRTGLRSVEKATKTREAVHA